MHGVVPHTHRCAVDAHRGELEHRVEGRDLQHADVGHAQHVGDGADGGLGAPALLLLRAPQEREHGGGLLAGRILGDLALGPGEVIGREGEAQGLLGVEAADGQGWHLFGSGRIGPELRGRTPLGRWCSSRQVSLILTQRTIPPFHYVYLRFNAST